MERPLLKEGADASAQHPGLLARLWTWLWNRDEHSAAKTIEVLQNVVRELTLTLKLADLNAKKKLAAQQTLMAEAAQQKRERDPDVLKMGRALMASEKMYRNQYMKAFMMRESVEAIKAEIVACQQSAAVFASFSKANTAMEALVKKVDMSALEKTMDRLQENMDSGKQISELLGTALQPVTDLTEEEQDEQLLHLVRGQSVAPFESASISGPKSVAAAVGETFSTNSPTKQKFPKQKEGLF